MSHSPQLGGSAGFTFEGSVAAYYLTSLLTEGYAPGLEDRMGSPFGDLIVDA